MLLILIGTHAHAHALAQYKLSSYNMTLLRVGCVRVCFDFVSLFVVLFFIHFFFGWCCCCYKLLLLLMWLWLFSGLCCSNKSFGPCLNSVFSLFCSFIVVVIVAVIVVVFFLLLLVHAIVSCVRCVVRMHTCKFISVDSIKQQWRETTRNDIFRLSFFLPLPLLIQNPIKFIVWSITTTTTATIVCLCFHIIQLSNHLCHSHVRSLLSKISKFFFSSSFLYWSQSVQMTSELGKMRTCAYLIWRTCSILIGVCVFSLFFLDFLDFFWRDRFPYFHTDDN